MRTNGSTIRSEDLTSINRALGSLKSGSAGAPGALFDVRSAADRRPSADGLREAVHEICYAIQNLLNEELDSAQACLQRAASALRLSPVSSGFGGDVGPKKSQQIVRGGLAPWQARLLKTHIETHLDARIRTKEMAKLVQLSSFHFCRVFRVSFGNSPHGYVTGRRIERAQGLILTTKLPLGQIAADCGFADQAHFTKLFRRLTGESPGEWRRVRADSCIEKDSPRATGPFPVSATVASSPTRFDARPSPPSPDGRNKETTG
jgi:AraC family transcriptional regulator